MAVTCSYGHINRAKSASADALEISRVREEGVPAKSVLPLAREKKHARTTRGLAGVTVKSEPEADPKPRAVPVSMPLPITAQPLLNKDPGPPNFQESLANLWALNLRIRKQSDGLLEWETIKVQMELAQDKGLLSQRQLSSAFTAGMIAQSFNWSQNGVILLESWLRGRLQKPSVTRGVLGSQFQSGTPSRSGLCHRSK